MPDIATGTNFWTKAQDAAMDLVASAAAFQAWVGAADAAAAKQLRVFLHEVPEPAAIRQESDEYDDAEYAALYPCLIVSLPEDGDAFAWQQIANDNQIQMECSSLRLSLRFENFVPGNQNNQQFIRSFENAIGDILEDMVEINNASPGQFGFTSMSSPRVYHESYGRRSQGHVIGFKVEIERSVELG